jgi:hypothetical protein
MAIANGRSSKATSSQRPYDQGSQQRSYGQGGYNQRLYGQVAYRERSYVSVPVVD